MIDVVCRAGIYEEIVFQLGMPRYFHNHRNIYPASLESNGHDLCVCLRRKRSPGLEDHLLGRVVERKDNFAEKVITDDSGDRTSQYVADAAEICQNNFV